MHNCLWSTSLAHLFPSPPHPHRPPLHPAPSRPAPQVHVDEEGNPAKVPGKVSSAFILKHCPVEVGTLYNMNDGRKTLQNVFALDLFDNVQVGGWVG